MFLAMADEKQVKRIRKSFWDVNQYKKTVKRIENGHRSCDDFMTMLQERAELEMKYSKSLKAWADKWEEKVSKGPEYGSTALAWKQSLQESVQISRLHEECRFKLIGPDGPVQNMQKWKKDNYRKLTFGGYQEIREAEEGFAAAQKDYAKQLVKTKKAKKDYHIACTNVFKAQEELDTQTLSPSSNPDSLRKLQQRVEKLANEQEKLKQQYQRRLLDCHGDLKTKYVQNMTTQFEKCQAFEKRRLDYLKGQLNLHLKCVDLSALPNFESIYKQAYGVIQSADAGKDLESWRTKYGTGMEPNWPKFEDYDIHADGRKFSFSVKGVRPSQSAREDGLLDDEFDSDDFEDFSDETDGDSNPKEVNGHHHVTASRQKDEDDSPYQNITPEAAWAPSPQAVSHQGQREHRPHGKR
ncbi:protein kinase C and casein kinase substrate in neurons protein 2-like [Ptychodera flava]|uniref:protein kinase C and casein kinase substrate in neurons protein 2-like n=1 Tax=Ptychodera flava TaxID=63121 RepID=UPI00396A9371